MSASKITLTFNKAMSSPTGLESQFSCEADSVALTIDSITQPTATTYQVNIAETLTEEDVITCDYTKGTVTSVDGGVLESFIDFDARFTVPADGRLFLLKGDALHSIIYELNFDTGVPINTVFTDNNPVRGLGGIRGRLYSTNTGEDRIRELDPDTLLSLSYAAAPDSYAELIGGTSDRLFVSDKLSSKIYELDVDTKLSINSASTPSTTTRGLGGTSSTLYLSDDTKVYIIDKDTLLPTSSVTTSIRKLGGAVSRLYTLRSSGLFTMDIIELDPTTLIDINTNALSSTYSDVGGTK